VHSLAQRVLVHIQRHELLKAGDRVGVAVSGGIDSVALLRLLLELRGELGIVLSVVHFNHKLRGAESDADQEFVAGLARDYDLQFFSDSDDVAQLAADDRISVEAAARELRYGFFRYLLGEGNENPSGAEAPVFESGSEGSAGSAAPPKGDPQGLKPDLQQSRSRGPEAPLFHGANKAVLFPNIPTHFLNKIVTGHTLDDQAETVLMRFIRGAGLRGLGGIYPRIPVEDDEGEICGEIVRPLLAIRRRELEQYLRDIQQPWREDSTNADASLTRNRVRKLVVPLLEKEFNPAVAENLAELADIARGEEDYWENEISGWLGTTVQWSQPEWARVVSPSFVQISLAGPRAVSSQDADLHMKIDAAPWLVMNASVSRVWLLGEPVAVQRRVVKAIGEHAGIPLEFKHVDEILRFAGNEGASGKALSLPQGWKLVREPEQLVFVTPDLRDSVQPRDYEYEFPARGKIAVNETRSEIELQCIPAAATAGYNPDHLLDAASLSALLKLRNWRPGDRFWPAHTKSPKKIKELLQERRVPQPERRLWPVVVSGDEIVWLRGFPAPAKFLAKPGREAVLILEKPLSEKSSA
jgi:tRNA(Ile)-lysidine synthase